ncbi:hypothetical protein [Algoriphagus taiwanensis]|uniref:Bacteriocin n=1 Tax=Algoriphagus taiwanensis TaxID=1445656 RepID=A0ABQ6Q1E4_9BACT|nr:hypothetical protein Ataiwa_16920 [Algoriphagus taiwanensis]
MEKLTNDQMENLVGGSDYCANLYASIFIGPFQGSDELFALAVRYFDTYCRDYDPQA